MPNKQYQLHLKGFVGGYDFDADYVDYILDSHKEDEVSVLIDSFGGKVNTALSISSAFHRHGNVHAHFVGMNASAATIASLGAKRITIDKSAMYLVHKCSTAFFKWCSLNADDISSLITALEKQKADLDKLDANIASMYADRCRKEASALLDLMRQGGWLTAEEALDWGFVDEITDFDEDAAPVLTDELASAMAAADIPLPSVPKQDAKAFSKFLAAITQFFTPTAHNPKINSQTPPPTIMTKFFKNICAILDIKDVEAENDKITFAVSDIDRIEAAIGSLTDQVAELSKQLDSAKRQPAATTTAVVDTAHADTKEPTAEERFIQTRISNRKLYDLLP